jgi:hypothetical protein
MNNNNTDDDTKQNKEHSSEALPIEAYIRAIKQNLNDLSIKQYVNNIKTTLEAINVPFTPQNLKSNADKIYNYLVDTYSDNSLKNKLNVFIILLRNENVNENTLKRFIEKRDELQKKYNNSQDNQLNDNDEKNYVNTTEYNNLVNKLKKRFNLLIKQDALTMDEVNEIIDYIILRFYQSYNLRADLANVKIVDKPGKEDENYLLWNRNNKKLILNVYKTSKKNGPISIDLSENKTFVKELKIYIDKLNTINMIYVIPNQGLTGSINETNLSTRFKNIFERHLNKSFNLTLNRKRLVSEDKDYQKLNELKDKLEEKAQKSGHSIGVAEKIYFKDNVKDNVKNNSKK